MIKPLRKYFVNWINGMKINKDNFVDMQAAVQDRVRDVRATFINAERFGLIPGAIDNKEALEYNLFIERPNQVNVELFQCRAILANGQRVELIEGSEPNNSIRGNFEIDPEKASQYFVLMSLDTTEMVPFGEPNESETPPRLPFIKSKMELHIVKAKDYLKGADMGHVLPIAIVECEKGEISHTQHYIPPSTSVASHPSLREFHRKLVNAESEIERYAFDIHVRLNQRDSNTELAEGVGYVCTRIVQFAERERDALNMKLRSEAPIELVLHAKRFARNIKNSLDLQSGKAKDEVLAYIQEVTGKSTGEYMKYLENVIDIEYDHRQIHTGLQRILEFSKMHLSLFKELSSLDYIGKKKKSDVFVAEKQQDVFQTKVKKESTGGSWDFKL